MNFCIAYHGTWINFQIMMLTQFVFGAKSYICLFLFFFNRWKLNNWDIDLTKDRYSMVGGRLIISNPEKSRDAGKYVCIVSNIFGTVRSSEATLSFGCKPMFMSKTRSLVVSLKRPVFLHCSVFCLYVL